MVLDGFCGTSDSVLLVLWLREDPDVLLKMGEEWNFRAITECAMLYDPN